MGEIFFFQDGIILIAAYLLKENCTGYEVFSFVGNMLP